MTKTNNNPYFNYHVIDKLTNEACECIDDVMVNLDVDYRTSGRRLVGYCPIHNGADNYTSWSLYPEGEDVRGFWKCRSHNCHKKYGKTFVGFIKGVLSKRNGKDITYTQAVDWLLKFLGYKSINDIKPPTNEEIKQREHVSMMRRLTLVPQQKHLGISRQKARSWLDIPAKYYLDRKFSTKVLDRYDVGLYNKRERIYAPIYDDSYTYVAGFVGRSIWAKCNKCKLYHNPLKQCPKNWVDEKSAQKWLNSDGFDSRNWLYNYWFALEHIRATGVAILVEGCSDVWRLEENGIHNSLGLFNTELNDEQRVLLDRSGAMSIVCLLDPDKAGRVGIKQLQDQLSRQYRMYFPTIKEDPGDLNRDDITTDIQPILAGAIETYDKIIGA